MEDAEAEAEDELYYDYPEANGSAPCEWPADWEVSFSLLPALYMLVFVLGLSGNGLVIATVWRGPRAQRRSADTYLGHLALADLAFVLTLPLWAAYTALRFHWPFGSALCKLSSYLVLLNMFASAFCLGCLSCQRYLAVGRARPRAPRPRAPRLLSLAALWLLAGLLALPALLLRDTRRSAPDNLTLCDMDLSGLASPRSRRYWLGALSLATTALGFLLPLLLMTLFYCCLGAALRRHFQHLRPGPGRGPRRRLLRIIVTLVAVFALCWLPFHLLKSLHVLSGLGLLRLPCAFLGLAALLHPYATCLAYVNSCLNPLLYAFLDRRFRVRCRLLLGLRRPPRRPAPGEPGPAPASSSLSAPTQKSELLSLATKV
ncbi:apelin receptor B-like [Carettochelys insculpta]|uniref:apelin receptor B-like n=1 Tax=Carettochelys insculpta TaxID=44489 RepID=UPI003EB8C08C